MAEFLTYPNRANTEGFPLLKGIPSVDATSGNLVITFEPHAAMGNQWTGGFYVFVDGAIATGAQPVVFATRGVAETKPLYMFNGAQATAAELVTTTGGVLICFYNGANQKLQVFGITN